MSKTPVHDTTLETDVVRLEDAKMNKDLSAIDFEMIVSVCEINEDEVSATENTQLAQACPRPRINNKGNGN